MTAKYDKNHFIVNGEEHLESNIVSVINDNRHKYVQCSCCGKVFRKGDDKFVIHQREAIKPETCFDCPHIHADRERTTKTKYVVNPDGTFVKKFEQTVRLQCTNGMIWEYHDIDSEAAIANCKRRQCQYATEDKIEDIFTQYPGIFDDIITIDKILDTGYYGVPVVGDTYQLYIINEKYNIQAYVNEYSIVDCFLVDVDGAGDSREIWYSKRYDEIFSQRHGKYVVWEPDCLTTQQINEIKEMFKNLYR
jgi:hypothetical protein